MYKLCKTEQSAARQRELEQGLLAAMSTQNYEEISISDLCKKLEIPRKSFYRYFTGKEGALHALLDHTILEFELQHLPTAAAKERDFQLELEQYFLFWYRQKPLLDALERSGLSGVLIERAIDHALEGQAVTGRFLAPDLRYFREQATMFAVCGLMSMVIQWHHNGYPQTVQQIAQIAARLVSQPLFPNMERFY